LTIPTYEYVCKQCGYQWEELQAISEKPIEQCPKCGHKSAVRQIGKPIFILKGGGWASDGYEKSYKPSE
jgi:putative FmdB family regulatory protein